MLGLDPTVIHFVDLAVLVAGGGAALFLFVHVLRRGGVHLPSDPPRWSAAWPDIFMVAFAGLFAATLYLSILQRFRPEIGEAEIGSDAWHWMFFQDYALKLTGAAAAVGLLVLRSGRGGDPGSTPIKDSSGTGSQPVNQVACGTGLQPAIPSAVSARDWPRAHPYGFALLQVWAATPIVQLLFLGCEWLWTQVIGGAPPEHDILAALHQSAWGTWGRLQLVVSAVVVAALAEELFFRGIVLGALRRATGSAALAIVGSGVLFAIIHLSVPQSIPPLIVMGLWLGYLRVRTDALGPCILFHAVFNARSIVLALASPGLI